MESIHCDSILNFLLQDVTVEVNSPISPILIAISSSVMYIKCHLLFLFYSSEQEHEEEFGKMVLERVEQVSPEKKNLSPKKKFKKDIKKVTQTDFSSLMEVLSL